MDPISKFEFRVDEQYENEKGAFTVVSIRKHDMVIRWANGDEMCTDIALQGRIQRRRQWEDALSNPDGPEAGLKGHTGGSRKAQKAFAGLQTSDFKDDANGTSWRGRPQLGGAVTIQLPRAPFKFKSWAIGQKAEMHLVDVDHYSRDERGHGSQFFVRLDRTSMYYGFCVVRPGHTSGGAPDWDAFAGWLMKEENSQRLQALAVANDLIAYDLIRPEFGILSPFEDRWRIEGVNGFDGVDMLNAHIDAVPATKGIDLAIARRIPKDEAVARGAEIADDIAALFGQLMPLYQAVVI